MSVLKRIERTLNRFGNWVERVVEQVLGSHEADSVPIRKGEPAKPRRTLQEIPPAREGIWVRCISCGAVHELNKVCTTCGKSLCGQTRFCHSHEHA